MAAPKAFRGRDVLHEYVSFSSQSFPFSWPPAGWVFHQKWLFTFFRAGTTCSVEGQLETNLVVDLISCCCIYLEKDSGEKMAKGHKASFCLEDTNCYEGFDKKFNCSMDGGQGISPGCYDLYGWRIDCQWVDCTDFTHGAFYLRVHINPGNRVAESDFRNNIAKCRVYDYGSWIISNSCAIGKGTIERLRVAAFSTMASFSYIHKNFKFFYASLLLLF